MTTIIDGSASATFATPLPVLQGGTGSSVLTILPIAQGGTGSSTGFIALTLSKVLVSVWNGYGSTNTTIRRYTTINVNTGTNITYADSATLGGTFTINATGVYAIVLSGSLTASGSFGITKNSTNLSSAINVLGTPERLSVITVTAAIILGNVAWVGTLISGDVIRCHGDTIGTAPQEADFEISRIS